MAGCHHQWGGRGQDVAPQLAVCATTWVGLPVAGCSWGVSHPVPAGPADIPTMMAAR